VETVFMNPEVIVPGPGDEIVSHKGKTLDRGVYESIRREFYELRGWDAETGEQKKGTLERMGLEELVE
jgi:aldehyde:ferredoxin oxidoreductase